MVLLLLRRVWSGLVGLGGGGGILASFLGASGGRLCRVAGVPATAAYERVVAGVVVGCLWVVVWALGG